MSSLRSVAVGLFRGDAVTTEARHIRKILLQQGSRQDPGYVKNAMSNVIKMINELVAKMQQQNRDDMRQQQQCDDQTKQAEENAVHTRKEVDGISLKIQQKTASLADLKETVTDLKENEVKLGEQIMERKQQFDAEDGSDKKQVHDCLEAVGVIDSAMLRLQPQAGSSPALQSALNMLSVVTADLEETIGTTEKAIEKREQEFTKYYGDATAAWSGINQNWVLKGEEVKGVEGWLPTGKEQLGMAQTGSENAMAQVMTVKVGARVREGADRKKWFRSLGSPLFWRL